MCVEVTVSINITIAHQTKCWIFFVDIHTLLCHLHSASRLDVGYTVVHHTPSVYNVYHHQYYSQSYLISLKLSQIDATWCSLSTLVHLIELQISPVVENIDSTGTEDSYIARYSSYSQQEDLEFPCTLGTFSFTHRSLSPLWWLLSVLMSIQIYWL